MRMAKCLLLAMPAVSTVRHFGRARSQTAKLLAVTLATRPNTIDPAITMGLNQCRT